MKYQLNNFSGPLLAALTETTTKTAAGISVGAETVKQITEASEQVIVQSVLSETSMVVAIGAGLVAVIAAVMNYRINVIRLEMEREEHRARMEKIKGLRDDRIRDTGTTET